MKLLLFVLLAGAYGCPWRTPFYILSASHCAFIEAESLTAMDHIADLPATVRDALPLDDGNSPSRDFILAACGPDHCFVEYGQNGSVPTLHVVLFAVYEHVAEIEWNGFLPHQLNEVAELRSMVLRHAADYRASAAENASVDPGPARVRPR
jgi:hypothetical protein